MSDAPPIDGTGSLGSAVYTSSGSSPGASGPSAPSPAALFARPLLCRNHGVATASGGGQSVSSDQRSTPITNSRTGGSSPAASGSSRTQRSKNRRWSVVGSSASSSAPQPYVRSG